MSQYWFKAKSCGWGIGAVTAWQGVLAFFILVGLIVLAAYADGLIAASRAASGQSVVRFALDVSIISVLFCLAVSDKIDGGLRWRWGSK